MPGPRPIHGLVLLCTQVFSSSTDWGMDRVPPGSSASWQHVLEIACHLAGEVAGASRKGGLCSTAVGSCAFASLCHLEPPAVCCGWVGAPRLLFLPS